MPGHDPASMNSDWMDAGSEPAPDSNRGPA